MGITYEPDVPVPPHRYVPEGFDATDPRRLAAIGEELLSRPHRNATELEAWLLDWSDLACAFLAARTRRRVAMTCDTSDAAAREAHLAFERDLVPLWQRLADRFRRGYLASPFRGDLGPRYAMCDRRLAAAAELFREENVPLLVADEELGVRYSRLAGARSIPFRGSLLREQECAALLEEPDRETRRQAYEALAAARAADAPEADAVFDEMLVIRERIARNAGCDGYVEFRFRDLQRFDYVPRDCTSFHAAVERHVVPALEERQRARARRLGVDALRPYDRSATPEADAPGRAFSDEAGLVGLCRSILGAVDPGFAEELDILVRNGLLDLMARSGKAPGGYNAEVKDIRLPFIFANSVGRFSDVKTLLHEAGHAFHTLATRDEIVPELSHAPMEFCEVASMTMELLGLERFPDVLPGATARAAAVQLLDERLRLLSWVATIDAFQHWIYTHPGHSREERRARWAALRGRFEPGIDWSGFEEARATEWHAQLHLFRYPFYYIEYGIALLGSLQIWRRFRRDPAAAVDGYRAALALGGSRPLPELFATAGARFALDDRAVGEAVATIVERLRELEAT